MPMVAVAAASAVAPPSHRFTLFSPTGGAGHLNTASPIRPRRIVAGHKEEGRRSATTEAISSPSNPFVKHCVKLRLSSSYRHSHYSTLVVGITPISEILRFFQQKKTKDCCLSLIECLLLLDGAEAPAELRGGEGFRVVRVNAAVMRKVSGLKSVDSTEAIAVMRIPPTFCDLEGGGCDCSSWFNCSPHRILVMDGIQDPGNLGTLLRSAMAFKWDGVFLLSGCCDPFNDKALRAARGSSFQLPIVSGNWNHLETLQEKFKMKMLAAHPEINVQKSNIHYQLSVRLANVLADKPLCLVLGSEGQGLSEQTKYMSELVSIPMAGEFESLNVSVAGGILLFMLRVNDSAFI